MASKKDNLKALLSNTRSRVIIVFTVVLLMITVIIGIIKLKHSGQLGPGAQANLTEAPRTIQSVPGSLNPTAQYEQLQEAQNVTQARSAMQSGGSAIPTIIRTQELGSNVAVVGQKGGESGVGFTTLAREDEEGNRHNFWVQTLKDAQCSQAVMTKILSQGATPADLKPGCTCAQLKQNGMPLTDLKSACTCEELKTLGFTARDLKGIGFSAEALRICTYSACDERAAGFTAKEMRDAGYSAGELKGAGFSANEIGRTAPLPSGLTEEQVRKADCQPEELKRLKAAGVTASIIREINACSAAQLRAAGFTAQELKDAGFALEELKKGGYTAGDLKNAGFSAADLKKAGFTPMELKNAGFSAADLKNAGFSAGDLKGAGFSAEDLKNAGFSAKELKNAGFSASQLKTAGFSPAELQEAGFPPSEISGLTPRPYTSATSALPGIPGGSSSSSPGGVQAAAASNAQQLQEILQRQNQQVADQRYLQRIQQRTSDMVAAANQSLQTWQRNIAQIYVPGTEKEEVDRERVQGIESAIPSVRTREGEKLILRESGFAGDNGQPKTVIKTGDILFAVLDTSVNSDEPGPILATIVSGPFKGAKLIGSFNLPKTGDKMVISFNTMSVPGASRTVSISAYAIDPNTARTALTSRTNHHYLYRYGALFASSFLEGFGNAFQSANTTVTIGGTGGGNNITVQNGLNRSTLQNAVIALATLGKSWGQVARQEFNIPTTVEVFSGTGLGILFTQDVTSL